MHPPSASPCILALQALWKRDVSLIFVSRHPTPLTLHTPGEKNLLSWQSKSKQACFLPPWVSFSAGWKEREREVAALKSHKEHSWLKAAPGLDSKQVDFLGFMMLYKT
jgi:hypothetical protein